MATDLQTQQGMHIDSDPKTGAIAASQVTEDIAKVLEKNDQPEQTPDTEEATQASNPRDEIMAKIYANRAEQFKKELEYEVAIGNGATVEPIIEETQPVVEQPKVEPVEVKTEAPKEDHPSTRKITIGNQQFDLTESEIEQLAQRTLYAENQVRQNYQSQHNQQNQQIQPQQQPVHQPQNEPDKNMLKEIARKITYGSEEESANALGEFANLTAGLARQQFVPPEQIVQAAVQQATAQVLFQKNLEAISSEYTDVFESRAKTLVAADKVGALRQKYAMLNAPKSDLELYREACKDTRSEFGHTETARNTDETKPVVQQTVSVSPTRAERKRAAPQTISAVNKVQAMQQTTYPTGSAVVAAMRAARGQSAM